jgi:hypothetical protein
MVIAAARPILPWLTANPANIIVASAGMGMQALSSSMSTKIPGRPNTAITFVHQLTTSLTMLCMQPSVNDPAGRTQPAAQLPAARELTDAAMTVAASPVHLPQTMPRATLVVWRTATGGPEEQRRTCRRSS